MVPLSADRALNSFFTRDMSIFTTVENAVVGDIPWFVSTYFRVHHILLCTPYFRVKKGSKGLTKIIKLVYKPISLLQPLDLVNLQDCWYWGCFCDFFRFFQQLFFRQEQVIYIAYFISKFGKLIWCIDVSIFRQHFTVDRFLTVLSMSSMGAFPWGTSLKCQVRDKSLW